MPKTPNLVKSKRLQKRDDPRKNTAPGASSRLEAMAQEQLPVQENLPLHSLDVGAEKGSGWTVENNDMRAAQMFPGSMPEGLKVKDGGEVNRAQEEYVASASVPVSDEWAKHAPVDIVEDAVPEYKDVTDDVTFTQSYTPEQQIAADQTERKRNLTEAAKTGLVESVSEVAYQANARLLREREGEVVVAMAPAVAYHPMSTAQMATDVMPLIGNNPEGNVNISRVVPSPYVTPSIAYDQKFVPPRELFVHPSHQIPGIVGTAVHMRRDSYAVNDLEKLVTRNPQAWQNSLLPAVFTPYYRNLQQMPSVVLPSLYPAPVK